ncbi:MAG TPA: bifunctional diaminohydroxyphosphoribosylaminopyrimidine deaminase/5-amino-6-(5-phosphoribosylamino)uracil reductase RibD [Anaeromyxobacteraceae bacterium]|jgi:diaminohydroxyphosphoribosylaminopyrimidine deaminase/5-amino-6-(5-phosphoribosylamino)uracil reductase|nr:bifunctional diaminohydroxyphosphoribosylaminopyrimidine deaminase/5-amino-6-(5-phosphoribosylamino)uracil reductase RibD [Anaeromyxobacteraceae bacterium]
MTRKERAAAEAFMQLALAEAAKGLGRTSPNPAVGVVLAKGGRVLARGHHARAGGPHAEVVALRRAGPAARGADLYTTLEPCSHFGRTPPCSLALLEAGVKRVFVGSRDPNLLVNGRGIAQLRRGGVRVVTGVLREACDALNAPWFRYITSGRPYVTLKAAITLDGKLATRGGDARWVSGEASRLEAHRLRDRVDAVLVGAGTARADDPRLTTRLPGGRGRDPVRVVLDARLELPPKLKLFHHRSKALTLVAHLEDVPIPVARLAEGVEFLACRAEHGRVDLNDLLDRLAARGIVHLLVEGGAEVHRRFLDAGLADRVLLFVAPKIAGGDARSWVAGPSADRMADALALEDLAVRQLGDDLVVTGAPAQRL